MTLAHGDDFVRVRPHGSLGDKGCDGYRLSSGEVYACYGTVNGRTPPMGELLTKIVDDAEKCRSHLARIMKAWAFVHNFIDGVPTDVILALKKLELEALGVPVTQFGPDRFNKLVMSLPDGAITTLLGPAVTEEDASSLDYRELREIVNSLAANGLFPAADLLSISPVSSEKLDYNALSPHWRTLLLAGLHNSRAVEQYFGESPDPLLGTRAADMIRAKFLDLEQQALTPDEILDAIYASVLGSVTGRPHRQVAALALIGYMFETCTLLKDVPGLVS